MSKKYRGRNVVSGSWGELWWDGEKLAILNKFELKTTPERVDIPGEGLDIDSKIVAVKAEGSFSVKKLYSKNTKRFLEAWNQGLDPRSELIGKLDDPDAFGAERVSVRNVWFNEISIMSFEKKKEGDEEYKFGCTASDIVYEESIT